MGVGFKESLLSETGSSRYGFAFGSFPSGMACVCVCVFYYEMGILWKAGRVGVDFIF